MNKILKGVIRALTIVLTIEFTFMLLWWAFFWGDNLGMMAIDNSTGAVPITAKLQAAPNSHLALIILVTIVMCILPFILMLYNVILHKFKYTRHIVVVGLIGGLIITTGELFGGLIINKLLGLGAYDYSHMYIGKVPLHFLGQINVFHSMIWFVMASFLKPFAYTFFYFNEAIITMFMNNVWGMFKNKGIISANYFDIRRDLFKNLDDLIILIKSKINKTTGDK